VPITTRMAQVLASPTLRRPRLGALRLVSDRQLARLGQAGQRDALTVIYERYHQPLYRYCRSLTGSAEDASDALQETMLAALRALPGAKRDIALKPWLFRIAHNECMSTLRRRRPQVELDGAAEVSVDGPEASVASREKLARLLSDLHELPERQRGALLLRELTGLEYDEIAATFGTSAAAAKQAVYDARVALHDLADGRALECDSVRRQVSARDGRMLRGRQLRSHLRDCVQCQSFSVALDRRQGELGATVPFLSVPSAKALLEHLAQHGTGGAAAAAGAGAGGGGASVLGALALKGAVAGVTAGMVAGGLAGIASSSGSGDAPRAAPQAATTEGAARGETTPKPTGAPDQSGDRKVDRAGGRRGPPWSASRSGPDRRAEPSGDGRGTGSQGTAGAEPVQRPSVSGPGASPQRPAAGAPGAQFGRDQASRRIPGGQLPAPAAERIESVRRPAPPSTGGRPPGGRPPLSLPEAGGVPGR